MLFFLKGRVGSTPTWTLEPLLLGLKSPSLQNFAKISYRRLKISKISKKNLKNLKGSLQNSNLLWYDTNA